MFFTDSSVDRWLSLAPKKIDHVIYGAMLWLLLTSNRLVPLPFFSALWAFLAFACGWELLEWVRYDQWQEHGSPQPRPEICDLFSYRDVVRDCLGIVLATLLVG